VAEPPYDREDEDDWLDIDWADMFVRRMAVGFVVLSVLLVLIVIF
jgi:hypothetical protein